MHPELGGKKTWASRGVLKVKFTEQEDTLGHLELSGQKLIGAEMITEGWGQARKILFCDCVHPASITGPPEAMNGNPRG